MYNSGESNSDDDSDVHEEEEEKKKYGKMSMEELLKLQENIGMKAFKKKVLEPHQSSSPSSFNKEDVASSSSKKKNINKYKRENKNRPREVPMMRRVAPYLTTLDSSSHQVKRKAIRDPRFDDLSGKLDIKAWQENYKFLRETRKKEKEILKKELKSQEDPVQKKKMKAVIQRMENQEREQGRREQEQAIDLMDKQQRREALSRGEKPKYMSKKEKKLLLKTAHFETLKKENRVDKYLERKEKRKKAKELKSFGDF